MSLFCRTFHGSTGFGEAFTDSIHGDHATKPFFDSEAAVDYMVSRGYIDESRIAAAGGSYGGYLVSWIAGHSSKYKALIESRRCLLSDEPICL